MIIFIFNLILVFHHLWIIHHTQLLVSTSQVSGQHKSVNQSEMSIAGCQPIIIYFTFLSPVSSDSQCLHRKLKVKSTNQSQVFLSMNQSETSLFCFDQSETSIYLSSNLWLGTVLEASLQVGRIRDQEHGLDQSATRQSTASVVSAQSPWL